MSIFEQFVYHKRIIHPLIDFEKPMLYGLFCFGHDLCLSLVVFQTIENEGRHALQLYPHDLA